MLNNHFDKQGKQLRILRTIANHIWAYGYQPSMRELAASFGWTSVGYINTLITDLKERGVIAYDNSARSLRFRWQDYVTERTLPWDYSKPPSLHPQARTAAKKPRRRRRKLGAVSK
jgi:SOS-response transcriptional repressor LexA